MSASGHNALACLSARPVSAATTLPVTVAVPAGAVTSREAVRRGVLHQVPVRASGHDLESALAAEGSAASASALAVRDDRRREKRGKPDSG